MKTTQISLIFLFLLLQAATVKAQKIEHVVFTVFGSSVILNYDLTGGEPNAYYTIDLYVSPNGKTDYQLIAPNELTGDVGLGIRPGTAKSIQWQASKSFDYPAASFKVKASYTVKDAPIENKKDDFMEMVFVEGGTFMMGSKNGESEEKPVHKVTVSSFNIGKYEVTQKQWFEVMGNRPSYFKDCDNCPVEQVSWDDIQEFIKKLNEKTGKHYRLPTEAEWEYAARGGNKSKGFIYSGSNTIDEVAWYTSNSGGKTHPVGQKQANELGIFDMTGNVWEWCSDRYGSYPSGNQTDPQGASSGSRRVIRGGSWHYDAVSCRSAYRNFNGPGFSYYGLGFRLAV